MDAPRFSSHRFSLGFLAAWLVCLGTSGAAIPSWWEARGLFRTDPDTDQPAVADDYALINQGQLKNLARGAFREMEARLSGGAGPALTALVASWENPAAPPAVQPDNHATVNLGQLKEVARPFFDRLNAVLFTGVPVIAGRTYPWSDADAANDEDYAFANLGQAKQLFSFELNPDSDGDGMPDAWETAHGFDSAAPGDAILDADSDGLSNREEYRAGTDPRNANTAGAGFGDAFDSQDFDGDGIRNGAELAAGTDPYRADSDGDGFWDNADAFPLDATRQLPAADPADHTPPVVTLLRPVRAP